MLASFHRHFDCQRGQRGFSLLEMSVVLVIISVILAGGGVTFGVAIQKRQYEDTEAKMAAIQKALRDYWLAFKRLPCPADGINYNIEDNNFGKEGANADTCAGTPGANFTYNIDLANNFVCDYTSSNYDDCVYGGMVPVKTLQLPDDYAFDGWGRRFTYAVSSDYIRSHAALSFTNLAADVGVQRITVRTANDDSKTDSAVYVLVSHGKNGHGTYARYVPVTGLVVSGSQNTMEQKNCHCDEDGTATTFDNIFYQELYATDLTSTTDTFDDVVTYATLPDLRPPAQ